jgi:hypothetical protein
MLLDVCMDAAAFFKTPIVRTLASNTQMPLSKRWISQPVLFFVEAHPFQAIYFGGGTPTALPEE